jgi:hypothetical protein
VDFTNALRVRAVENMDDVHNNRHASELLHRFEASDSEGFSVVRGYAAMSAAVVVVSIAWAVAGEGASHFVWCFLLIILAALWLEPILSIPHTIELEEKRIVLRGPHETKHLIDMRGVTDVRMIEGTELWVRSIFAACCMTHCYVTDNTKAVLVHSDAMGRWQWSYIVSVTEPELLVLMGKEAAIVERQEELMRLTTQPKYVQAAKTLGSTDVMKLMYQHFYADAETETETASRPDVDSEPEPAPESEPAPGQDVDSESKSYPTEGEGEPPLQLPGDKIAQGTEEPAP